MGTGRTYGGEPADARASRRRGQLLRAGLEVFGTTGYRKATVRHLCREAHVADRNFYEEFPTTEDLLLAVYHDCLDRIQDAVVGALPASGGDVRSVAGAGLEAFLRFLEEDPRIPRVVWFEVLGVSPRVDAAYIERTTRFGELLLAIAGDRGLLGPWHERERQVVVSALVGGISQVVLQWVYHDFTPPRATLVPALTRVLLAHIRLSFESDDPSAR